MLNNNVIFSAILTTLQADTLQVRGFRFVGISLPTADLVIDIQYGDSRGGYQDVASITVDYLGRVHHVMWIADPKRSAPGHVSPVFIDRLAGLLAKIKLLAKS